MKNKVFRLLIITLVAGAAIGIFLILANYWNVVTLKIFLTTIIIFGFSIPGLCCSTLYEKENLKELSIIGMMFCLLGCIYAILTMWIDTYSIASSKILFSLTIISISFGHISLLLLINSIDDTIIKLKYGTIAVSLIFDLFLLFGVVFEASIPWQLMSILIILVALGSIVTPIVYKLQKSPQTTNHKKTNGDDKYTKLSKLKELLDNDVLTEEEYKKEKEKILNE
jgi:hypothetical protein